MLCRNAEDEGRGVIQTSTWEVLQLSGGFKLGILASSSLCRACSGGDRLLGDVGLCSTEGWPVL